MRKLLILCLASLTFTSCKKETNNVCYQCMDFTGSPLNQYCGSNEADAYSNARTGGINGNHDFSIEYFRQWWPRSN